MNRALLIIDVQNDFCPGGALAVAGGDDIVPVINAVIPKFALVVASKDWHPKETVHFDKWPAHCVCDSFGAEFHPELDVAKINKIILKGTKNKDDGYSAFEATNINLHDFLIKNGITTLYVCGLATDYCVEATVMDAISLGYKVHVIRDAVAAVNIDPRDGENALCRMAESGAVMINSVDII